MAREIEDAWPWVRAILESGTGNRALLIAAIEAAGSIRPDEAAGRRADDGHGQTLCR